MEDYQIILVIYEDEKDSFENACNEKHLIISMVETNGEIYNQENIDIEGQSEDQNKDYSNYLFYKAKLPDKLIYKWDTSSNHLESIDKLFILEEICNFSKSLVYYNNDAVLEKEELIKILGYIIPSDIEKRKRIANNARENWWNIFYTNIDDVREFYGEYNAYYFAWLQHLTKWLFYLSIFGLVGTIFQCIYISSATFFSSIYSLIVPIWCTVLLNKWDLFNHEQNYKWKHHDFEITESLRSEFSDNEKETIEYLGHQINYTPKKVSYIRYLQTYSIYSFFIGLIIANSYLSYFIRNSIPNLYGSLLSTIVSTVIMVVIEMIFKKSIILLNEFENHTTDTSFQNGLVIKNVIFNFVNTFYNLYYTIIYEPMAPISIYLLFQFFFKEILIRHFKDFFCSIWLKESRSPDESKDTEYDRLCKEFYNSHEEVDTVYQHTELIILFSYMTMFACFFPIASILFLFNNHYEMIKDLKSLEVGRLKLPTKSGGIGLWKDIYRYSLYISILSNTYFLFWASYSFSEVNLFLRLILILAFEHFIIFLGIVINFFMPTVPAKLQVLLRDNYQKKQRKKIKKLYSEE